MTRVTDAVRVCSVATEEVATEDVVTARRPDAIVGVDVAWARLEVTVAPEGPEVSAEDGPDDCADADAATAIVEIAMSQRATPESDTGSRRSASLARHHGVSPPPPRPAGV